MNEQIEEGYVFFRAGCIALVLVLLSIGSCTSMVNYTDDTATVELVSKGASVLEARCAIRGSSGTGSECAILAARKP